MNVQQSSTTVSSFVSTLLGVLLVNVLLDSLSTIQPALVSDVRNTKKKQKHLKSVEMSNESSSSKTRFLLCMLDLSSGDPLLLVCCLKTGISNYTSLVKKGSIFLPIAVLGFFKLKMSALL